MFIKGIKKIINKGFIEPFLIKNRFLHKEIDGRITYGLYNNSYEKMKKKWSKLVKLFRGY